jgi:hypothetical protein
MSTASRLDELYRTAKHYPGGGRWVFMSDRHKGDGAQADNSVASRPALDLAQAYYRINGFQEVDVGDWFETWQFPNVVINKRPGVLYLKGNHDQEVSEDEAIIIDETPPILVCHGHQGDVWSDSLSSIARWFVRYPWTILENMGVKEPTSPDTLRHESQRQRLIDWARTSGIRLIHAHVHVQEHIEGFLWDCGKCCDGKVQAVELDRGILTLVDWSAGKRVTQT